MTTRIFDGRRRVDAIAADGRGVAYGDGLFETMRVHRGTVPWWDAHWARLQHGAQRLHLRLPEPRQVREEAADLFANDDSANDRGGVLKLIVTRGGGGRGYAPPAAAEPSWLLSRYPVPVAVADGLRARWCETRLASQPLLAGIKHCNRLEQVLARAECIEAGVDEGLMRDLDGNVVSATSANLFVFRDGRWLTPLLDRCGVAGVCRAQLLPALQAREARLDTAALEAADAVFLCNAVRGILPLARLGARAWPAHPAIAAARVALARRHPAFALDVEHP
ncbi:aminodeoxychorismate lyase [Luteimonas sp. 50]|uniref:Aminodeoxychorismate lyase n=1 Tax=Cognatiluteimonas sedimenti TaxID=2927791 RepID=A0ABT0A066_9GAMM|nr:aminodeoxychorismate lyase [Lysobacter sedimenti]MCJ0824371.1 aminodeoxychorismate lyase [Lysobacter sedimenti]